MEIKRYCRPLVLLPPILSMFTAAGLWGGYFAARHYGNVLPLTSAYRKGNRSAYPPYISFTGNFPPVSCFFSEILNLTAFTAFVVGIFRYFQLKTKLVNKILNITSVVFFAISCFGMTIVGNFQILEMWWTHIVGTFVAFGSGTLYCWLQSYITWKVNLNNQRTVFTIGRVVLSGAITICIILHCWALLTVRHMHSARCQWAVVMLFLIYISTFAFDFCHCRFEVVCRDTVEQGRAETTSGSDAQALLAPPMHVPAGEQQSQPEDPDGSKEQQPEL